MEVLKQTVEVVLITGGTGLIGTHLSRRLQEKGYDVIFLSRSKKQDVPVKTYTWDPETNILPEKAIAQADYIIHLAGANIGDQRWTPRRKQQIADSRINSAQLILNRVKEQKKLLKAFISASAIGYYGTETSDKIFTETDPPVNDFLGNVCKEWERMADKFNEPGIRTVKLRTGVVLTSKAGALSKMMYPVKIGLGSALGNGKQYMPWIHIDDLCELYVKAIEDSKMKGAYNAVAPDHKTNQQFIRTLAEVLKKPVWFPNVPAFVLKGIFGKMSDLLLQGSRVSADKVIKAGFKFRFPDLRSALKNLLK